METEELFLSKPLILFLQTLVNLLLLSYMPPDFAIASTLPLMLGGSVKDKLQIYKSHIISYY